MKNENLIPYIGQSVSATIYVYRPEEIIHFIVIGDLDYNDTVDYWYIDTPNFETGCAGFKASSVSSLIKLADNKSVALLIEINDYKE